MKRRLYWDPAWVYITLLGGVLIYAILALVLRKTAELHVRVVRETPQPAVDGDPRRLARGDRERRDLQRHRGEQSGAGARHRNSRVSIHAAA